MNSLLQHYKEHCRTERKQPPNSSETPAALLPVSFAQAKDWLLRQKKAQSEALETGAVKAREVVTDLNHSLAERQQQQLHFWSSQLTWPLQWFHHW